MFRKLRWQHGCCLGVVVLLIVPFVVVLYISNRGSRLASAADLPTVKRIVQQDPESIHTFPDGKTPLHYLAARGQLEEVKFLVSKGADISRRDENRHTAEQWARQLGQHAVADYLEQERVARSKAASEQTTSTLQ